MPSPVTSSSESNRGRRILYSLLGAAILMALGWFGCGAGDVKQAHGAGTTGVGGDNPTGSTTDTGVGGDNTTGTGGDTGTGGSGDFDAGPPPPPPPMSDRADVLIN